MKRVEDRFTRGFLAGLAGGGAANLWSFFAGAAGLSTLRFVDWTGIIVYGHTPPFSAGEIIYALVVNLGLTGGLGILFSYLVLRVTSRHLLFKGWLFAEAVWFFFYAVTTLYKVDGTVPLPLNTAIANAVASMIFGLVQAYAFGRLGERAWVGFVPAPAMKREPADDEEEREPPPDKWVH